MTSHFRHSSKSGASRRRLTAPSTPNEDLFLNLANDGDAAEDVKSVYSSRGHRRKSIPTPNHKDSSPAVDADNERSTSQHLKSLSQSNSAFTPRRSNTDAVLQNGNVALLNRSTAIKHSALNGDSPRDRLQSQSQSRRQSLGGQNTPSSTRNATLRLSELAYSTPDTFETVNAAKAARDKLQAFSHLSQHADGAESEASTTAPSTVWDELNELKARMKRLEHSGTKSRQNSNTADAAERPRTGTTQTTASTRRSSHTEHPSPTTTKITAPDVNADLHPLLQSALTKARLAVGRSVYNALENCASDAVQMAMLAHADQSDLVSTAGSTVDGVAFSQKRVLRKADNLCRDLTELCIALCESNAMSGSPLEIKTPYRPVSRDQSDSAIAAETNSPLTHLEERRKLADRVERLSNRYGPSRLAERRDFSQSTVLANRMGGRHASVNEASPSSPWAAPAALNRSNTTSSRPDTRNTSQDEQSPDRDATIRGPPTRAMSEAQRPRPTHSTSRDSRGSREYTSRHPLPNQSTNSLSSGRTIVAPPNDAAELLSPTSEGPFSPTRSRRRRANSNASSRAPPSTGAGLAERLEAKRQQQVASASQLRGMDEPNPVIRAEPRRRSLGGRSNQGSQDNSA